MKSDKGAQARPQRFVGAVPLDRPSHRIWTQEQYRRARSLLSRKAIWADLLHLDRCGEQMRANPQASKVEIALMPSLIRQPALHSMTRDGDLIRAAMLRLIEVFRRDYQRRRFEKSLFRAFLPYSRWWALVAQERRRLPAIQFMRYDVHYDEKRGRGRFLETNSDYPGGFLQCALVRQAWMKTALADGMLQRLQTVSYSADRPDGFLHFLAGRARRLAGGGQRPAFAICNDQPDQRNEVLLLKRLFEGMMRRGGFQDVDFLLCRMEEVECRGGGEVRVRGRRVDLIHNELEFLDVDPENPAIAGWLAASRSPHCDFLNALGACYLTQTKRIAAVLADPAIQHELGLSGAQKRAVKRRFPPTRTLGSRDLQRHPRHWLRGIPARDLVLKPDALGMGEGVVVGRNCSPRELRRQAGRILRQNGIVQRFVPMPRRFGFQLQGEPQPIVENYGFELFFWGSQFAGPVSRSSPQGIINVSKGGKESPVLVVAAPHILT